jgi:hypothetical protein
VFLCVLRGFFSSKTVFKITRLTAGKSPKSPHFLPFLRTLKTAAFVATALARLKPRPAFAPQRRF